MVIAKKNFEFNIRVALLKSLLIILTYSPGQAKEMRKHAAHVELCMLHITGISQLPLVTHSLS